ncbi:MAG: aspartate/glutamate racemase family protein [Bacteroidales bacterium]|nr:aspartate/glutamate racemase family protein [Bacteroidales bacterium]
MKSNGLVLGVLGGMGPAASAEFMRLLAEKAPAERDQEHPRVILYSDSMIPNRTAFLEGKGEDPSPYLLDGIQSLLSWGADLVCVTCNTAHVFIDSFPAELLARLVHIVEETIYQCRIRSPKGAWLTATLGTMNSGLYQVHASRSGYDFRIPDAGTQREIHDVTDMVKEGKVEEAALKYKEIIERLWAIDRLPVVGACTELPIAYDATGLPPEMGISSLDALAEGCIRELYKPVIKK